MANKYLDTAAVDVTFNAWWVVYGRRPSSVHLALQETKDQIQGPMPPNYVPPPWRKNARASVLSSKNGPTPREIERARQMAGAGRRMLENDLKLMAAQQFPGLPADVALQIKLVPCTVNPKIQEAKVQAILNANRTKIANHNANNRPPQVSNGPPRDIDREYEQRAAQRAAVASLRRQSNMFNGPEGRARAEALLANKHALMLLDGNYLAQNPLAAGFYGIARQKGFNHDAAMESHPGNCSRAR